MYESVMRAKEAERHKQERKEQIAACKTMKNKGYSNAEISDKLGMPESTVRVYLKGAN